MHQMLLLDNSVAGAQRSGKPSPSSGIQCPETALEQKGPRSTQHSVASQPHEAWSKLQNSLRKAEQPLNEAAR